MGCNVCSRCGKPKDCDGRLCVLCEMAVEELIEQRKKANQGVANGD